MGVGCVPAGSLSEDVDLAVAIKASANSSKLNESLVNWLALKAFKASSVSGTFLRKKAHIRNGGISQVGLMTLVSCRNASM